MNWALIASGSIALFGALAHGVIGDRIVRRIDAGSLRSNPFGDGGSTKFLIRVTWHFTTIAFVVVGTALILSGMSPHALASTGSAYVAGAVISCWAAFALIAGYGRGGVRGWLIHPAPIALTMATILVWLGSASL